MMIEPQKLDYVSSDFDPPAILSRFRDQDDPIEFPVSKVSNQFLIQNRQLLKILCIVIYLIIEYIFFYCFRLLKQRSML